MKGIVLKVYRDKLHKGEMKLIPETLTDLWHLYNIIEKGDTVYAKTFRRIRSSNEPLRADKGEKTPVYLGITVEDAALHKYSNRLRVRGIISSAPENVSRGSYHTINVETGTPIKIIKSKWPKYILDRIGEAEKLREETKIIVISMEEGEASIAVIDSYSVDIISNISVNIPGKRFVSQHDEAIRAFFSEVYKALNQFIASQKFKIGQDINKIVIVGPGFIKDNFLNYLISKQPVLKDNLVLESSSYGGINGIYETIKRGIVAKILEESKVIKDSQLLEEFFIHLSKDDKRVVYGNEAVERAVLQGAVEKLLITDEKLRTANVEEREKYDELLRQSEHMGGKTHIISTLHRVGERLRAFGGIAAILRFPLAEHSSE
jgi:protein pelota